MRQIRILCHLFEIISGLDGQLASRRKDYASGTYDRAMGLKFFDDRNHEGSCLTATCSGHRDDVEALQNDWNRSTLDRRWQVVTFLLNCLVELRTQIVALEATTRLLSLEVLVNFLFGH